MQKNSLLFPLLTVFFLSNPLAHASNRTSTLETRAYTPIKSSTNKEGKEKPTSAHLVKPAAEFFYNLCNIAMNNEDKEKQGQYVTGAVASIINLIQLVAKYDPNALKSEYDFNQALRTMFNDSLFRDMLTAQIERRGLIILRHYAKLLEKE